MAKKFVTPFATSGDKTAVPNALQPDGTVSYAQGFGPDYELDKLVDPVNAKDVPRNQTNQLYFDLTDAVGEVQKLGAAIWSSELAPYGLNTRVYYSTKLWRSNTAGNSGEPGVAATWDDVSDTSIPASTTVKGIVELATDAETISGASATLAVVPAGLLAEQKSHPAFSANRNNVNQTAVASGVATKILFTTEVFDNSAAFDTTLSRYTPLMAGIYHVTFASRLNNATNESSFTVFIYKNGTQFRSVTVIQSGAAGTQSACISEHIDMNGTTDYLEFFVVQDTGTARDVLGTTLQNYASAALVVRR